MGEGGRCEIRGVRRELMKGESAPQFFRKKVRTIAPQSFDEM